MVLGNEGWEGTPGAQMDSATTKPWGLRGRHQLSADPVSSDVKRSRPGCTMPVRVSGRKPWISPDLRGPPGDTQGAVGHSGSCRLAPHVRDFVNAFVVISSMFYS